MGKRLQAGKDFLEKGFYEKAIKEFTIQLSSEKEDMQSIYLRGIAYRKQGKLTESLKDFDKAIRLNPNQADLLSDRAITYHLMNRGEEAIKDLDKAVELDITNPYRYSCRAYVKEQLKDAQGAISDYNKAVELDPQDEVSFNNLGVLQEKLGKIQEAQKNFKTADEILKNKGQFTPNKETEKLDKQELKINHSADGKVSFESPKKQKEIAEKQTSIPKNEKVSLSTYFQTLKSIFSSKKELELFVDFVKSFFKK